MPVRACAEGEQCGRDPAGEKPRPAAKSRHGVQVQRMDVPHGRPFWRLPVATFLKSTRLLCRASPASTRSTRARETERRNRATFNTTKAGADAAVHRGSFSLAVTKQLLVLLRRKTRPRYRCASGRQYMAVIEIDDGDEIRAGEIVVISELHRAHRRDHVGERSIGI